jgi:hypothetical protein
MHEINPRAHVDGIPFGAPASLLVTRGYAEDPNGHDSITNWRTFKNDEDVAVYVEDDVVVCIACFRHCAVAGEDLIGRSPSELVSVLGSPDEVGEEIWVSDDTQQTPYEYFSLGLQVWFESDRVVSVFCNDSY